MARKNDGKHNEIIRWPRIKNSRCSIRKLYQVEYSLHGVVAKDFMVNNSVSRGKIANDLTERQTFSFTKTHMYVKNCTLAKY